MKQFLIVSIALIIIAVLGLFGICFYSPGGSQEKVTLLIPKGKTLGQVAQELHDQKVIVNATLFKWLLRLTRGSTLVRAGEYEFHQNMSLVQALHYLYYGQPILHAVTIPEGFSVRQIASLLAKEGLANEKKFLEYALSEKTARSFKIFESPHLEGYLYPNTYQISKVDGEQKIVEVMVHEFFNHYYQSLQKEAERQNISIHKLVTLASIIEKETGVAEERPLIASVFWNRLRLKMRLQSDPTTIYGIQDFDGNLTKRHLTTYSPYNTYVIPALPPGPICSPGLRALESVLKPAQSPYLYFVANKKGGHVFAATYQEHNRNVSRYQLRSHHEKTP